MQREQLEFALTPTLMSHLIVLLAVLLLLFASNDAVVERHNELQ